MPPQEKYRQRIRDIRPFSRPNPDGSRSTVLLEQADNYAYPTLFPVDPNNPDAGWIELKGDEAFKEAEERGEVFEFGSEKEAMKFAEGSWKHLEEKPSPRSINDIMQKSNLADAFTQPVSTGTAHDAIDNFIDKPNKSVIDFIKSNISTVGGLNPEDTSLGKAITQIVQERGNPYIMPIHSAHEINPQVNTKEYKDYMKERYGTTVPDTTWIKYMTNKHDLPSFHLDERKGAGDSFFPVDTVTVPFGEDFIFNKGTSEEESLDPIRLLLEELTHQQQYQGSSKLRRLAEIRRDREMRVFDDPHETPGTQEWEAHKEIYPKIRKRFETLLDSLSQPFTLESLFPNQ